MLNDVLGMKGERKRVTIIVVPLVLIITAPSVCGVLLMWQVLFRYYIIEFLEKS